MQREVDAREASLEPNSDAALSSCYKKDVSKLNNLDRQDTEQHF